MTLANPFAGVPLHDLLTGWEDGAEPPADEGWALFESQTYGFEIERDDEAGIFASDDDALTFVRMRAKAGSVVHQMALAIHEAQEAENKAAAQAAGYTIRAGFHPEVPVGAVWGFVRPGETLIRGAGACRSQTAAWSAAWRDLLEHGEDEGC